MSLKNVNFRMFSLIEDMKILRDREKDLFAYLPFFPSKQKNEFIDYKFGFIKSNEEIIYVLSKEEWNELLSITC